MEFKREDKKFYLANRDNPEKRFELGVWSILLMFVWDFIEAVLGLKHGNKASKELYRKEVSDLVERVKGLTEEGQIKGLIDHLMDIIRDNGQELDPSHEAMSLIITAQKFMEETFSKDLVERYAEQELRAFEREEFIEELIERAKNHDQEAMRILMEIEAEGKR